jgi:hypothetical protein
MTTVMAGTIQDSWPQLALDDWKDTYATLHRWLQIIGKTRLALAPMQNHWWQVTLYPTARGLGTSPMPYRGRSLELELDFIDHLLVARTSDGATRTLPLVPRSVAEFYREYMAMLRSLDIEPKLWPVPVEMSDAMPFKEDVTHASYDPETARRCWRILAQSDRVFKEFRGRFVGKCSPSHFWWGGFDLACTRFSGLRAPPHPGGIPNAPDYVMREAYSHECISAGWWPGNVGGPVAEPAYYAYAYPEPAGCASASVRPSAAQYHPVLREWILPYAAVREARDPDAALFAFLESTYEAAAELARWDRASLERSRGPSR